MKQRIIRNIRRPPDEPRATPWIVVLALTLLIAASWAVIAGVIWLVS